MKLSCVERKYIVAGLKRIALEAKSKGEIDLVSKIIRKVNGSIRYEMSELRNGNRK